VFIFSELAKLLIKLKIDKQAGGVKNKTPPASKKSVYFNIY